MTSSPTDGPSSIERLTVRNPDAAKILRANLAVYARRSDDPEVRDLVADVLAGRRDLGEVLTSKDFNEVGGRHLDNLIEGVEALQPEEKERAFARTDAPTPEAELARMRDDATPGDGWAAEDTTAAQEPFDRLVRPDQPRRQQGGFLR